MARNTASTRQPPAGGPGDASGQDGLLRDLRRGERDGFVRYFRLYRTPVYDFALRLLHDEEAAAAAAAAALSAAFRRVILDDRVSDLQTLTYRCAFDACAAHDGAVVNSAQAVGSAQAAGAFAEAGESAKTRRRSHASNTSDRFEASLDTLEFRQRAALLLHDVQGLGAAQLAVVFSTSAEAAAALLFRARVEFRGAFHARSAHVRAGACRQAEQTVAGTVGLGLSSAELERLRSHAAYCKPCRKAMQGWRPGAFGLALVLDQAPPPKALAAPPVFGAAGVALAAPPVAGAGWLARALRPAGRTLRSRWAAYVVAAACLALAAGVVLREDTVRRFVLFESVGPAVQLVRAPDAEASRPDLGAAARVASLQTASGVTSASIGEQTGTVGQQAAARPAVPSSTPGQPTPTAGPTDAAAPDQVADPDGAAAADSDEDTAGAAGDSERDGSSSSGEKRNKDAAKSDDDRSSSDDSGDEDKSGKSDKSGDKDKSGKSGDKDKSGKSGDKDKSGKSGDKDKSGKSGDKDKSGKSGDKDKSGTSDDKDKSGKSGTSDDRDKSGKSDDGDRSNKSGKKDD